MAGLGLVVLILGAVALVVIPFLLAQRGGPFVLKVVRAGGVIYAVLTLAVTAGTVIPLAGGDAQVSVPLHSDPVVIPKNVTFSSGPTALITGGGVDRATLSITHLGIPTRVLLIGAALAVAAVSVVIALSLSRIASTTLRGAPFVPGAARLVTVAAIAIAVGGTASAVLQQWGEWSAGQDALSVTAWTARHVTDASTTLSQLGWPEPASFALQIPFLPLLLGVGLAALAAVFRAGERLQRDAEGLV